MEEKAPPWDVHDCRVWNRCPQVLMAGTTEVFQNNKARVLGDFKIHNNEQLLANQPEIMIFD